MMIGGYPITSRCLAHATNGSRRQKRIATKMKSPDSTLPSYRISFRRCIIPLVVRMNASLSVLFLIRIAILVPILVDAGAADAPISSCPSSFLPVRLKGNSFDADWGDFDAGIDHDDSFNDDNNGRERPSSPRSTLYGFGREISLFETSPRGGARNENYNNDYSYEGYSDGSDDGSDNDEEEDDFLMRMERYRERRRSFSSISSGGYNDDGYPNPRGGLPSFMPRWQRQRNQQRGTPNIVQRAQGWWMKNVDPKLQSLPKIVCRIEPTTTLKLRKTFRPLKTIIRLGADYNTQQGIWQFKSSWEDAIIGGKLTLSGNKELQLTKSWHLSVGGVEDLATRLRFRATINLQTFQAYARVGFRTERLTPIDVVEGFTVLKRLPLDGSRGNLKLEVKANVALPEPEIEYSTEAQRSLIGMGNIEVNINEMNLLLDY